MKLELGRTKRALLVAAAVFVSTAGLVTFPGAANAQSLSFGFGSGAYGGDYAYFGYSSPRGYYKYGRNHRNYHYNERARHHRGHHNLEDAHDAYHYWNGPWGGYNHRRFHRDLNRAHRYGHRELDRDHSGYHGYW